MLSVAEAALRLGVTQRRVRQLIDSGGLKAEKVGRDWVLREATVERFAQLERPPGRKPQ